MSHRYDLLVIDLDGTLLSRDGRISAANRRAVERARDAGMEVVIATGRALVESLPALTSIEHDGLLVAAGGSLLCETATGRTIDRRVMPHDLVRDVTHALLGHGHKVLILKDADTVGYDYLAVGPGELDPASKWWFEMLPAEVRFADHIDEDDHPHDSVRAAVVACGNELAPLARDLKAQLGERAFLQHWAAVTESQATGASTHLLEVFSPNVSKWTMVMSVCEQRGVEPQRVAAIGDGLNDVEIIANAGLGVAMGNADPRVMAVADRTAPDHDADGVATAIKRILAGEW
jgi:5-amino-6-(5-phospho-D-ribitylamino)uracil phosphatase